MSHIKCPRDVTVSLLLQIVSHFLIIDLNYAKFPSITAETQTQRKHRLAH